MGSDPSDESPPSTVARRIGATPGIARRRREIAMPTTTPNAHEIAREVAQARARIRVRPPNAQIVRPEVGQESVWDYPRPPRVEFAGEKVIVAFDGATIAETGDAIRVIETAGAPVIYIAERDVVAGELRRTCEWTLCEWKGVHYYYDLALGDRVARRVGWSFPDPFVDLAQGYERLRGRIAFYPNRLVCTLGGEIACAQPGGYYGGWVTSRVVGPFKGNPGSEGW